MNKETYERLQMDVTKFDVEDVITTSGVEPGGNPRPDLPKDRYEITVPFGM